jgi:ATP-dependent Lon protease
MVEKKRYLEEEDDNEKKDIKKRKIVKNKQKIGKSNEIKENLNNENIFLENENKNENNLNFRDLQKKSFENNNMSDNENDSLEDNTSKNNINEKITKSDVPKKQIKKKSSENNANLIELNISDIAEFISTHINDDKNKAKNKISKKEHKKVIKGEIKGNRKNMTKISEKQEKKKNIVKNTKLGDKKQLEVLDIENSDSEGDEDYIELEENEDDFYTEEELEYMKKLSEEERQKLKELEKEIENSKNDEVPERIRILKLQLPINIRHDILRKYDQLSMMEVSDNEYFKLNRWMDGLLDIPFGKYVDMPISSDNSKKEIRDFIYNIYNTLNDSIYGHEDAKNKIIQIVAQWISNPSSRGSIIALQGPPGIGKTSLIKDGVAKALNRPFHFIALGGATDASTLEGHNYTYEGAMWGRVAGILMDSKCMNPVIFFDELDKVSETKHGEEIIGILTHLTDQSQNSQIYDRYFAGIPIDLSRALIVFSFNEEEKINPILKDRLTVIRLKGFDEEHKIKIAKEYLIEELMNNIGLGKSDILFNDELLKYIIRNYTQEEGVRSLKRCIESILMKLNVLRFLQLSYDNLEKLDENMSNSSKIEDNHNILPYKITDFKIPFILNTDNVRELLKDISIDNHNNISKNMMYL